MQEPLLLGRQVSGSRSEGALRMDSKEAQRWAALKHTEGHGEEALVAGCSMHLQEERRPSGAQREAGRAGEEQLQRILELVGGLHFRVVSVLQGVVGPSWLVQGARAHLRPA